MFSTSETIAAIAAALADAQTRIGGAVKDRVNPAFKSSYATLASVDEAVRPELSAVGIAIVQAPSFDRETNCVVVTTQLIHKSGEWLRSDCAVPVSKQDAQGIGSATTYGRRFGLAAMCGVAPADDDDGNAAVGNTHANAPQNRETPRGAPLPAPPQKRPAQADADALAKGKADIRRWVAAMNEDRENAELLLRLDGMAPEDVRAVYRDIKARYDAFTAVGG